MVGRSVGQRLLALPSLLVVACAGDAPAEWLGTIDTLASGVIHVSNPEQGLWGNQPRWQLAEVAKIGTQLDSGPEVFGNVWDIEVDEAGRVYVFDWQAQDVRLFEGNGAYVRTIGRPGRGPGEFRSVNGIAVDSAARLWVHNQGNLRYSVFDTSGALLMEPRATATNIRFVDWISVFSAAGDLMEQGGYRTEEGYYVGLRRYDLATESLVDVNVILFGPPTSGGRLFSMTSTLTPKGRWRGDKYEYRLVHTEFRGDTVRIIERARDAGRLSAAERDSARQQERDLNRRSTQGEIDIETTLRPIFEMTVLDDLDHVWVMLASEPDDSISRFDVFDPVGRYLGEVAAPHIVEMKPAPVFGDHTIYYVTKDQLDVQYVVVAEIRRRD
jgi:hypothetical protein